MGVMVVTVGWDPGVLAQLEPVPVLMGLERHPPYLDCCGAGICLSWLKCENELLNHCFWVLKRAGRGRELGEVVVETMPASIC